MLGCTQLQLCCSCATAVHGCACDASTSDGQLCCTHALGTCMGLHHDAADGTICCRPAPVPYACVQQSPPVSSIATAAVRHIHCMHGVQHRSLAQATLPPARLNSVQPPCPCLCPCAPAGRPCGVRYEHVPQESCQGGCRSRGGQAAGTRLCWLCLAGLALQTHACCQLAQSQ